MKKNAYIRIYKKKETKQLNTKAMGTNAKQQNYFTSVWVEVRATKGIVTKKDEKLISNWYVINPSQKPAIYLNFKDKATAIKYLENSDKKLSKRYECRIFTDLQKSRSEVGTNGLLIPFTSKQLNEVYYI